jgi:hypothetical protein
VIVEKLHTKELDKVKNLIFNGYIGVVNFRFELVDINKV